MGFRAQGEEGSFSEADRVQLLSHLRRAPGSGIMDESLGRRAYGLGLRV